MTRNTTVVSLEGTVGLEITSLIYYFCTSIQFKTQHGGMYAN